MITIRQVSDYLRDHVWGAMIGSAMLSAVASAALTSTASDFVNHRNTNRALVQADYDKAKSVQLDVDNALQKFADKANGLGGTNASDVDALLKAVKNEYSNAEQLTIRIPKLHRDFEALSSCLIALQNTALKLQGPADGASFVEAVDAYYDARDKFNNSAVDAQSTWLALN